MTCLTDKQGAVNVPFSGSREISRTEDALETNAGGSVVRKSKWEGILHSKGTRGLGIS